MRKIYSFAVLLVMLLASTTVKAQNFTGSATATYYGSQNYATTPISFSLTAIADAFGISDAATLAAMLDDQYPEDRDDAIDRGFQMYEIQSDESLIEGIYTEDEKTFTADPIGFYLNKDGDVVTWSSADDIWFYVPRWNAETDEFYFNCGRKAADASFAEGYTGTATFYLRYNGSIALSFKLTYTVEPKPEVPEVETEFSKLTIFEGVTVTLEQDPRSNYNSDAVKVEVPTLLSDLGITQTELVMADAIYARAYEEDTWQDRIFNDYSATPHPGFWFGSTYNEDTQQEDMTNLAARSSYANALFYAVGFAFSREEGVDYVTFDVGQEPSAAQGTGDEEYHATIYIAYGDKAYPINIILKINYVDHSTEPNLATYEKAGEIAVSIEGEYDSSYQTIHAPIDAETIATEMGAESPQDLQLWVRTADGGDDLRRYNDGGPSGDIAWVDEGIMWINNVGVVVGWSSAAATMISYQMLSDGTYTIGGMDMPGGQFADETPYTMSVFLCYPAAAKYYEVIVTRQVSSEPLPEKKPMDQWEYTKTFTVNASVLPAPHEGAESGDHNAGTVTIPMEDILLALGVDNVKNVRLYAQRPIEGEEEPYADGENLTFTNSYTCTPHPGFWMGEEGKYPTSYGNSDSYGMTLVYSTGVITIWNKPSTRTPGDNYSSVFYLVDDIVGKYVKLNFNLKFVSSLVPIEIAGEQDVILAWDPADEGISLIYPDLEEAVNAMFDGDDSMLGSCDWLIEIDHEYQLRPDFGTDAEGCLFDAEGKYICQLSDGDEYDEAYNTAAFGMGFDYIDCSFGVSSLNNLDNWVVEGVVKVNVAMEYEGKRWIFHCLVGDKDTIETGISDITINADNKKEMFDLTGRRVAAPVKGLYIVNGKKVMVK